MQHTRKHVYCNIWNSTTTAQRRTIITALGIDCKEKRICGYNQPQCLVVLSVPPDVIERDLHISNRCHGELSSYLLNAPVVILSLAVLLIFIETEPAEDFRVFTQTC